MTRLASLLADLRRPVRLLQILGVVGALAVGHALLSATNAPPKPWESDGPAYLVGAMEGFSRTFPSRPLPDTTLESEAGPVRLSSLADGTPLVVNLWATWCAPCLEELPALAELQGTLGDDVKVLAVAMEGGDGTRQRAMLDRLGASNLTLLWDPQLALGRAFSEDLRLPITVLYDRSGREIGRLEGAADWAAPESVRLVRAVGAGSVPRQ